MTRLVVLILVLYALLLATAFSGETVGIRKSASFSATRKLVVNHRVEANDVRPVAIRLGVRTFHPVFENPLVTSRDFIGRYVSEQRDRNDSIDFSAQTTEKASPSLDENHSLVSVPLTGGAADLPALVDANDTVVACGDDSSHTCTGGISVVALSCTSEASPKCSATFSVSDADRARFLTAVNGHAMQLLVHKPVAAKRTTAPERVTVNASGKARKVSIR